MDAKRKFEGLGNTEIEHLVRRAAFRWHWQWLSAQVSRIAAWVRLQLSLRELRRLDDNQLARYRIAARSVARRTFPQKLKLNDPTASVRRSARSAPASATAAAARRGSSAAPAIRARRGSREGRVRHRGVAFGGRMHRAAIDRAGRAPGRVMQVGRLEHRRDAFGISHGGEIAVIGGADPARARRIGAEIARPVIAHKRARRRGGRDRSRSFRPCPRNIRGRKPDRFRRARRSRDWRIRPDAGRRRSSARRSDRGRRRAYRRSRARASWEGICSRRNPRRA